MTDIELFIKECRLAGVLVLTSGFGNTHFTIRHPRASEGSWISFGSGGDDKWVVWCCRHGAVYFRRLDDGDSALAEIEEEMSSWA